MRSFFLAERRIIGYNDDNKQGGMYPWGMQKRN